MRGPRLNSLTGIPYLASQEQDSGRGPGTARAESQHGRLTRPEDANADYGSGADMSDLLKYFNGTADQLPSVITDDGAPIVLSADFSTISNLEYFREAADAMAALGVNDQKGLDMTNMGGNTVTKALAPAAIGSPNFLIGLQLEWSIPKQFAQAFTMQIQTIGFKSFVGTSVDRNVSIKLSASQAAHDVGGIIQVPFAYRVSTSDTPGYQYFGQGGMQAAILCLAYIPPIGTASIPPVDYINSCLVNPDVRVTTTDAVRTNLSVTVRPITAASPALAAMRYFLNS